MVLLFPQVEMFSEVGWQQAADAVVRKKHVKVPQQPAFGFIWFVLCPQDLVWDDLLRVKRHMINRQSKHRPQTFKSLVAYKILTTLLSLYIIFIPH